MPALRHCRHCRKPFLFTAREAYCSVECESAHEQQSRVNVDAGIAKRLAKTREYNLHRRGRTEEVPAPVVANWLDLTYSRTGRRISGTNGPSASGVKRN